MAASSGTTAVRAAPVLWLFVLHAAVGAQTASGPARTRDYRYLMGTSVAVEVFGGTEEVRRAAIDEAFAAVAGVDRLMSNYRHDSELSLINRSAAGQSVHASDPMFSVLQAAERVSARSGGAFDVTVGPLVALWGFHDQQPHLPTATELATIRPLIDHRNVILDSTLQSVRFARSGVAIDLGGIAKGFAVEVAAGALRRRGVAGLIDAGGNQYLLGTPPGKSRWTAGVRNPDTRDRLLGVIETTETSISTSADDASFLTIAGRRYGHILDPRTLRPSDAALSVTVLSPDGTLADALSKAAFILGPKAGLDLIDSFPGMSGVIAYRASGGGIAIAMSPRLRNSFHPAQ